MRSLFYPLLGERVWGWPAISWTFWPCWRRCSGLATSLGFGAAQASAGLNFLFDVPLGNNTQILLVIGITAIALMSVVAGWMRASSASEINMMLAVLLLVFVIAVGPTLGILGGFFKNLGAYLEYLPALSNPGRARRRELLAGLDRLLLGVVDFLVALRRDVHRPRIARPHGARVHRLGADRTSLACVLWMTVFGETAITQVVRDGYEAATRPSCRCSCS